MLQIGLSLSNRWTEPGSGGGFGGFGFGVGGGVDCWIGGCVAVYGFRYGVLFIDLDLEF